MQDYCSRGGRDVAGVEHEFTDISLGGVKAGMGTSQPPVFANWLYPKEK